MFWFIEAVLCHGVLKSTEATLFPPPKRSRLAEKNPAEPLLPRRPCSTTPAEGPPSAAEACYWTPGIGPLVSKQATDDPVSPMSADGGLSSTVADWLFINSWWLLLPFTMLLVVAAFVVAFVLLLYMISPLISPKPLKLNGAHVVVSGANVSPGS